MEGKGQTLRCRGHAQGSAGAAPWRLNLRRRHIARPAAIHAFADAVLPHSVDVLVFCTTGEKYMGTINLI